MSTPVALIVGLGNPGPEYRDTRHNAGAWWVEAVAARYGESLRIDKKVDGELAKVLVADRPVWLFRPGSYMNVSGTPVRKVVDYYSLDPEAVLVAHDELELEPGQVRARRGGGAKGHNGIRDLARHLGPEFLRLRIGIGRPPGRGGSGVERFVLKAPSAKERERIDEALDRALAALPELLSGDPSAAEAALAG